MAYIALLILFTLFSSSFAGFGPGKQDYGYVNVRKGAHMFWWLYYTTANITDATERPLILWLEGGPGGSSCGVGNFILVGPLDENLKPRDYTWVKDYNILFIDSPVAAGFSYVDDYKFMSTDNKQIARDLLEVVKAFFQRNPKFKTSDFYLYGISYGGKIAMDLAMVLNDEIQSGGVKCNFKGVSMGNGWVGPVDISLSYASFLYGISLVNKLEEGIIKKQFDHVKQMYEEKNYYMTTLEWIRGMSMIQVVTDGVDIYDVRNKFKSVRRNLTFEEEFRNRLINRGQSTTLDTLMNGPVKQALGIPNNVTWGGQAGQVFNYLFDDFMTSVVDTAQRLLNDTDIEIHISNGNFDLIVNTPGTFDWINTLTWKDEDDFWHAERTTIWVNGTMEGYQQKGGRLNFYWINGAGHDTITGNPAAIAAFLKSMTGV